MSEKKKEDSAAEGILNDIGKVIPGLGGVLKNLEKSPAFKERLEKIDVEIERKMKDTPLKRTEGRSSGFSVAAPPGARPGSAGKKPFKAHSKTTAKPSPPPESREFPVDIFDEEYQISIIVEMPGVDEKEIKIDLEKDVLTISTDNVKRKYNQKLKLPCSPKGKLTKTYRNGILEVVVGKIEDLL